MTKSELKARIEKVALATNLTKEEVAAKLFKKDAWTWMLINQVELA